MDEVQLLSGDLLQVIKKAGLRPNSATHADVIGRQQPDPRPNKVPALCPPWYTDTQVVCSPKADGTHSSRENLSETANQ